MIFFFHEQSHIGGGQIFVNAYRKILNENNIAYSFSEKKLRYNQFINLLVRKYSLLFLHLYSHKYVYLSVLSFLLHLPTIVIVYGVWFLEYRSQNDKYSYKKAYLLKISQGILLSLSKKVVVFSNYEKKLVSHYYPHVKNKIVVIPGGVQSSLFFQLSLPRVSKLRKKLSLPIQKKIFLVVSRLEKRKGITKAIKAFSNINQKLPNCFLCIIFPYGPYNQISVLENIINQINKSQIGEKVHLITGIPHTKISQYYQASDIFLMSSTELETFGLTTLEALASGCIVVGFKNGATTELLSKIDNKLLVENNSVPELSKKMIEAINLSLEEKKCIKTKASQLVRQMSWEKVGEMLIENIFEMTREKAQG